MCRVFFHELAVHVYLRSIVDAPQIEPDILVDVLRCWFVFGAPVVSPVRRSCFIDVGRIVQVAVDKGRGEIEVVVVEEGVDAVEGGEELLVSKAFSILLILLDMAPITCSMRDICDKIADDAAVLPLPPPPPPPPLLLLLLLLFKSASGILTLSSGILYFSAAT